jgi:hypothetical protein
MEKRGRKVILNRDISRYVQLNLVLIMKYDETMDNKCKITVHFISLFENATFFN